MKRLLNNTSDWTTIAAFMASVSGMEASLDARLDALDALSLSGIDARIDALEAADTSFNSRIGSLETWRGAKATASANMTVATNLPTVAIVGLISTVTKAGVEAELNGLKTEINTIKGVLRTREILAT